MSRLAALVVAAACALATFAMPTSAAADSAGDATYSLERLAPSYVEAGDEVYEVLRATGDDGLPLAGLSVRFVRTGPDAETAESCSVQELSECDVTRENGLAYYQFGIGPLPGVVEVRAEVFSPEGVLVGEAGPDAITVEPELVCRGAGRDNCPLPHAYLAGHSKQGQDVLRLTAPTFRHNSSVVLLRMAGQEWVATGRVQTVDRRGHTTFSVRDRNDTHRTRYLTVLLPMGRYDAETNRIALR